MSTPPAPVIGSFDCAGLVNAYSLQCEIVTREGDNGGLLRDGTEVKDILARKVRLSWTLNSMSAAQYAALKAAIPAHDPASVTVYDPYADDTRTANFYVDLPPFVYAFTPPDSAHMSLAGQTLSMEEA